MSADRATRSANASLLASDWTTAAAHARAALEAAPTGRKVPALEDVAAQYGIGRDLLRRAVTALRMVEKMRSRGIVVPIELDRVPVGVVDIVTRWAAYDRDAAFDAVRRYDRGELQFREMMREEAAARPAQRAKRTPRRSDVHRAHKEACLDNLDLHLRKAGLRFVDDVDAARLVDKFARSSNSAVATAILVAGPYENGEKYRSEMIGVVAKAVLAARLGHPVWLVVPGLAIAKTYKAWLDGKGIPVTEVRIIGLRLGPDRADVS